MLANQMRALPGPQVLDCPDYLLRLERCFAGSGALGSKPDSVHPLCTTLLGWEVSLPQMLRFFLSSPPCYTVQSRILRSVPSSHDRNGTGGTREQSWICGYGGRKQDFSFPLPRRPSAQRRLLFFQRGVTRPGASGKFL